MLHELIFYSFVKSLEDTFGHRDGVHATNLPEGMV